MRVKIVQLDGAIMNLALSKIAKYHHNQGDAVSFEEPNPDLIYYGPSSTGRLRSLRTSNHWDPRKWSMVAIPSMMFNCQRMSKN